MRRIDDYLRILYLRIAFELYTSSEKHRIEHNKSNTTIHNVNFVQTPFNMSMNLCNKHGKNIHMIENCG